MRRSALGRSKPLRRSAGRRHRPAGVRPVTRAGSDGGHRYNDVNRKEWASAARTAPPVTQGDVTSMSDADTKRCSRCDERLPRSCFPKDAAKSDGLYPACRVCRGISKGSRYTLPLTVWKRCACGTLFRPRHNRRKYVMHCSRACGVAHGVFAKDSNAAWTDKPTRDAVHQRLRNWRRKVECSECGATGRMLHWALNHDRASGRTLPSDRGPYSMDIDDYDVLCVPCHKRRDLAHIRNRAA